MVISNEGTAGRGRKTEQLNRHPPNYRMAGTRGLRTHRGSSHLTNVLFKKPSAGRRPEIDPAERQARSDATLALAEEMFNRPRQAGELGFAGPVPQSAQERAMEKIKDTEARQAAEGNTDLNHDNLEGGS